MFDDPKKELKRLEEQLLAAEMSDDDFERFYEEIYDEFGEKEPAAQEDDYLKDLLEDVPVRNYSNNYGKTPQASAAKKPQASRDTYTDSSRYAAPVKKDRSIRTLTIIACLETLGIVGVVLWWVLRIL